MEAGFECGALMKNVDAAAEHKAIKEVVGKASQLEI